MQMKVKALNKYFNGYHASRDISFEITKGKLIGLLGPSGGGKTTILRMLAGLETPDSGEIWFDDKLMNGVAPRDRGIGFVFQNYALFRHMTVYDNIAFGLTVQKKSKQEIKQRVEELIQLTGLSGLEKRLPHQLSGGQKQRVAFARALAPEPQLLLLDEPFAAIDAKVRKELRTWLKEMIRKVGITTIFVTHDQEEAVEVADEIMIIHQGHLVQHGTPIEIYQSPNDPFVASFIGDTNRVRNERLKGFEELPEGARILIRPEFIEVGRDHEIPLAYAAEEGVVTDVFFRGRNWEVEVRIGEDVLTAYRSLEREVLQAGDRVLVLIHRLYSFTDGHCSVIENAAKTDPMPVHI